MRREMTGVLLAAGQSKRFSGNKLLQPLRDGTPVVVESARRLCSVLPGSLAVVDNADGNVAKLLMREGLHVIVNPRAEEGIGSSIACGVAASREAQGWLIALADMPCISTGVIRQLVGCLHRGADSVAPVFQNRRGHPVGFSSRHAGVLMQLSGDEGARRILAANHDRLELIETDDEGVIVDIDEADDLRDAQALIYGR